MHSYFEGWKRKVGTLTLAMAILLLALWFRAQFIADQFTLPYSSSVPIFSSNYRGFEWEYSLQPQTPYSFSWAAISRTSLLDMEIVRYLNAELADKRVRQGDPEAFWKWEAFGIRSERIVMNRRTSVSHWVFIYPLAILSAWLLLSKSKSRIANGNNQLSISE